MTAKQIKIKRNVKSTKSDTTGFVLPQVRFLLNGSKRKLDVNDTLQMTKKSKYV